MHYAGEHRGLAVIPASGSYGKQVRMIGDGRHCDCMHSFPRPLNIGGMGCIDPDRFSNGGTMLKIGILSRTLVGGAWRLRKTRIKALDI